MASAALELVPPISMSRPFWSNHSRALAEAMSALFWWSAVISSIFRPSIAPPISSMAMRMASTPPGPSGPEYTPDRSVMKPIRMTSSENCACAAPEPTDKAAPHRAADRARDIDNIPVSSYVFDPMGSLILWPGLSRGQSPW